MASAHDIEVYVRFCETDAAGHVNNVSYFLYLEEARTKLFKTLGMSTNHGNSTLNFILASTSCDYVSQAFAGEHLRVATTVDRIGTKSFRLHHIITNMESDVVIAEGSATVVCYNYVEQKTIPIPDFLRKNLESRLENHAVR